MPSLSREPSYGEGEVLRSGSNALTVGNPRTSYLSQRDLCASQSTAPSFAPEPRSALAAATYSGASALQWPHQGA